VELSLTLSDIKALTDFYEHPLVKYGKYSLQLPMNPYSIYKVIIPCLDLAEGDFAMSFFIEETTNDEELGSDLPNLVFKPMVLKLSSVGDLTIPANGYVRRMKERLDGLEISTELGPDVFKKFFKYFPKYPIEPSLKNQLVESELNSDLLTQFTSKVYLNSFIKFVDLFFIIDSYINNQANNSLSLWSEF